MLFARIWLLDLGFLYILLLNGCHLSCVAAKSDEDPVPELEDDFEFEETGTGIEVEGRTVRTWIQQPDSSLCKALACRRNELCLLEDAFTAVCVNKAELKHSGDRVITQTEATPPHPSSKTALDPPEDLITKCRACPVVRSVFLCGSDNRTYSSLCRLQYHNCIHDTHVSIGCKGSCPCKDPHSHMARKQQQRDRVHMFVQKYTRTMTGEEQEHPLSRHHSRRYKNTHRQTVAKSDPSAKMTSLKSHNEVVYSKSNSIHQHKGCSPDSLRQMGERLVDWFSVIRSAGTEPTKVHKAHRKVHFPVYCKSEVQWMFRRLDVNYDSRLSLKELYDLEHDQHERCLKPFLDTCDFDRDVFLSPREWCKCFNKVDRPCTARLKMASGLLGTYRPSCDKDGYYHPLQCHASIGTCWCVDKHGVEFSGSRTRGTSDCSKLQDSWTTAEQHQDVDRNDDDDDDADVEGSGTIPIDF